MLSSKQRARLRSMANRIDTIGQVGKGGINDNVICQADEALRAREMIKLRVLETAPVTVREACEILCEALKAEPVQVIGTRLVLYRKNPENPKIKLD